MLLNTTMSSTSKFKYFLQIFIVFILLFQVAESITCCQNNVNESACARTCQGERCLKLLSPGGRTIRHCINGRDPVHDFIGHRHNDDGEDAYICSNEDRCNSVSQPFIYGSLLIPVIINLFLAHVYH